MKFEKREITLNEKDSLTDALFMQKTLLNRYVCALESVERTETRKTLLAMMQKTAEDYFYVTDLLNSLDKE